MIDLVAEVAAAVAMFPARFGLAGHQGVFRVGLHQCYVNHRGVVMLYTQMDRDGEWTDFAKGTVGELAREAVGLDAEGRAQLARLRAGL